MLICPAISSTSTESRCDELIVILRAEETHAGEGKGKLGEIKGIFPLIMVSASISQWPVPCCGASAFVGIRGESGVFAEYGQLSRSSIWRNLWRFM